MSNADTSFEDIKQRLDQIVERVSEDDIDLDEALTLYEEAVKLGVAACDASEFDTESEEAEAENIEAENAAPENPEAQAANEAAEEVVEEVVVTGSSEQNPEDR